MRHLTIRTVAWAAWATVGTIVLVVEGVDRLLRYAPGRRLAATIYSKWPTQ